MNNGDLMIKIITFLKMLYTKAKENELMLISSALTYKLLISIFPFIIFLMTLIGFFNIGIDTYIDGIYNLFPEPIQDILSVFLTEVIKTKRIDLLSSSFLITIYSASTGFNSIMQGLNRVYEKDDKRGFLKRRGISVLLVFIFATIITIALILFIFRDFVKELIIKYTLLTFIPYFLGSLGFNIFCGLILLILILIVYKITIYKRLKIYNIIPGALFTVLFWFVLTKGFNIYIENYSRYSKIYGSIGGIFVLVIWINMISFVLLLGGQINAILEKNIKI